MRNNNYGHAIKILRSLLIGASIFLLAYGVYFLFVITFWPYQVEYREAATASTAYEILSGRNPFDYAEQPNYTNVYGLVFSLVSAAVAVLPGNAFVAARIVSALFIIINCVTVFFWLKRKTSPELGLPAATLLLFYQLYSAAGAFPMSLGIFFSMVPIFLIDIYGWSWKSLAMSFLCSLLGFMTKPYFIVNIAWVGLVSLVVMPIRTVLAFACLSALGFVGAVLIVHRLFPAYFDNVFFTNMATATWDQQYLFSQLKFFLYNNMALLFGIVLSCLGLMLLAKMRKISLPHFKTWGTDLSLVASLGGLLLFYVKLGGHTGAAPATYLIDLCGPFLLVAAAKLFYGTSLAIARQDPVLGEYGRILLAGSFLVNGFVAPDLTLESAALSDAQRKDWEYVSILIARSENPLVSPSMDSIVLQNNRTVYDSGMSEYFIYGRKRGGWVGRLFPPDLLIESRWRTFLSELGSNIAAKRYDLIALTANYSPFVNLDFVSKYYDLCQRVHLAMPLSDQNWETYIFLPKEDSPPSSRCVHLEK